MRSLEFSGRSVDEAIFIGLNEMGVTIDGAQAITPSKSDNAPMPSAAIRAASPLANQSAIAAMANKTTVNTSKLRLRLLPAGLAMICGSEAACKVCSAGDSVGLGVSLILFSC